LFTFGVEAVTKPDFGKALVPGTHFRETEPILVACRYTEEGDLERNLVIKRACIIGLGIIEFQSQGKPTVKHNMLSVEIREAHRGEDTEHILAIMIDRLVQVHVP